MLVYDANQLIYFILLRCLCTALPFELPLSEHPHNSQLSKVEAWSLLNQKQVNKDLLLENLDLFWRRNLNWYLLIKQLLMIARPEHSLQNFRNILLNTAQVLVKNVLNMLFPSCTVTSAVHL